jgi:hypothetical protein
VPLNSRQARGRATQQIAAAYFRDHGFPYAQAITGAATGRDILNMIGLALEVKATADRPGPAALRQARGHAKPGEIPTVIWRPNGLGALQVEDWVVMQYLGDWTRLVRSAGYGDPLPEVQA